MTCSIFTNALAFVAMANPSLSFGGDPLGRLETGLRSIGAPSSSAVAVFVQSDNAQPTWLQTGNHTGSQTQEFAANLKVVEPKKEKLPAEKRVEDTICSVNSTGARLVDVLTALQLQTKSNLILLAPVETTLTVHLTNVRLGDILRHICGLTGLSYLKLTDAFVVAPAERLKEVYPNEWKQTYPEVPKIEPIIPAIVNKTYYTNYVDGGSLANTLKEMFKDEGLIVASGPAQMTPQLSSQDTSEKTGISSGMMGAGGTAGAQASGRLVILRGPQDVVDAALESAKALDSARPQVSIAVTIHDISDDSLRELGVSWTIGGVTLSETDARGLNFGNIGRTPFNFAATIKALEKNDKAKLLATPNIVVLDGEKAFVLIGSRLNFPVVVGFTQANTPIFDKQEERVGVYLQVAPSISSDDMVTLSLYPQVSTVTGFIEVNGGSYPQIATREAQTTLRLKSGETMVMGGLLRDEELSQIEQVPILGKIPILGELFTRRKKTKTSSQVIISITPIILKPAAQ